MQNMINRCVVLAAFAVAFPVVSHAQTTWTWDGGGGADFFSHWNNWQGDSFNGSGSSSDTLAFAGGTRLTPNNDLAAWADWKSILFNSGASSFTITGNQIDLFDTGGNGKIENNSSVLQSFNVSSFSVNSGTYEFNPVSGSLTLGGGGFIYNNSNFIDVFGNGGHTLTIGKDLTGTGGLAVKQNSIVEYTTASTYSGDTFIEGGQVRVAQGGSIANTTIRVGNTSGSQTAGLFISDMDGGTSIGNTVVIRSGTSGTRTVGGLNTSGNNTYSGPVSFDGDGTLYSAAGGTVTFSGVVADGAGGGSFTATIDGGGTVVFSGASANSGNSGMAGYVINSGTTLQLNKTAGTAAIDANTTVNGTLQLLAANQITDSRNVTVNSGGTFNLNGNNETINSLTLAAGGNLSLGTGQLILDNQAAGVVAGAISGSAGGSIVKKGANTVSITGNNSGMAGDWYVVGGIVGFNHNNAAGSGTIYLGETFGSDAATIDISSAGVNLGTAIEVRSGSGGNKTIDNASGGTITFSGGVTLDATAYISANGSELSVFSGGLSGSGGIIKQGDGTVRISASSGYSGYTFIDEGTLSIGSGGDITGSSGIDLGSAIYSGGAAAATLDLQSGASDLDRTITVKAGAGSRTITSAGTASISGTILQQNNLTVTANSGTLTLGAVTMNNSGENDLNVNGAGNTTIGGVIAATSGASDINKSGSGTLTLSGNNSSLFKLNIAQGTVALNHANALGSAYADKVNFTGSGTLQANASIAPAGLGIRVASGQTATLDVTGANTLTVGGALAVISGSGTFTKTGSGTLAISGDSTYTGSFNQNAGVTDVSDTLDASAGITVNGGRLNVGTGAFVGDVNQNSGTVSGGGTIVGNFVQTSGVLSPGNSPGTLFVGGNATWNGGSYLWEVTTVNPGTPGTDWDYVDITGTLTIGAGYTVNVDDLNALPGWDSENNYSWLIATAADGISGFGNLGLSVGGFNQNPYGGTFALNQVGNTIVLDYTGAPLGPESSAVPEPNALSLTMLAGLLLVSFRHKMRQMRRQLTTAAA